MRSTYLKGVAPELEARPVRRPVVLAVASALLAVLFLALLGASLTATSDKRAASFDTVQWAACIFGPDSTPATIYQYTQTSDLQYVLFSKSYMGQGATSVDSITNKIIEAARTRFGANPELSYKSLNEAILGTSLDGLTEGSDETWNGGETLSPYDRFGVAGMYFTAYQG